MLIGHVITDKPLPDIFDLLAHAEPRLNLLLTAVEWRGYGTRHDDPHVLFGDYLCIRGQEIHSNATGYVAHHVPYRHIP